MSELTGSHRLLFFIGDNTTEAQGDPINLAGVAGIFSGTNTPISTPADSMNITVPLTPTLMEKNIALSANDTVPVLTHQLHWVLQRVNDDSSGFTTVSVCDIKSLQVAVVSHIAEYPEDKTQLPIKSDPTTYVQPTAGKDGGLQPGNAAPVGEVSAVPVNGTLSGNSTTMTRRSLQKLGVVS